MMWGKAKENGAWVSKVSDWRILTGGDRIVYLAAWRFRLRLMKPYWMLGPTMTDEYKAGGFGVAGKGGRRNGKEGAATGPHWTRLTIALLKSRTTLAELKEEKDD